MAMSLAGALPLAQAFEPGHERICTPSADGQTFECRDKASGQPETAPREPATVPATTAATAMPPAPAAAAPPSAAVPVPSELPNYLLQDPSATSAARDVAPATESSSRPAAIEAEAAVHQAAPVAAAIEASPAAAPGKLVASNPAADIEAAASATAAAPVATMEPVQQTAPATTVEPAAAPPPAAARVAATAPSPAASREVSDASAFHALPGSHFTLVLASVRDPAALDELIQAFAAQPGQLYLLKLGMPDGDWYSLCWSDFADLDAARAARASLPPAAPIRSGWPRRIDLLQKELAR